MTPADDKGNEHLIVVVDQFSRYLWGMPAKSYEAGTIATTLFIYFTTFGIFDELWSDPGSDLMSDAVKQLNSYLGIRHVVSLVDRHESNGVALLSMTLVLSVVGPIRRFFVSCSS